ncbi:Uncharacterised protein [Mycobacteroides abscessus subsp. abscessus]|nr:Uncharacterised protein [Mycobacteroides abscessus subsp. abscessus]
MAHLLIDSPRQPSAYCSKVLSNMRPELFRCFSLPDLNKYNGVMFNNKGRPILASEGMNLPYAKQFIASSQALLSYALR